MYSKMNKILKFSEQKIASVSLDFKRYLYDEIIDFQKSEVILGIVGLRWIGKTTLLLQIAKEKEAEWKKWLYFSCDSFFVYWKFIFDIIEYFYDEHNIRHFYIDEVHKQKDWEQSLKTAYDVYDDIKIIFSWSSSVDLIRWTFDLSRRAILRTLNKFSFREYLNFTYWYNFKEIEIKNIFDNPISVSSEIYNIENNILKYYKEYNEFWEFWFFWWKNNNKRAFLIKIENVINKLIYEDISNYYNIQTSNISLFFKILKFIANSWSSNLNYSNIAKQINTTSDTIKYYIEILQEIWILNIIWKEWRISVNLRKSKKWLFETNNIAQLLFDEINTRFSIWLLRESSAVSELKKVWEIYYSEKWDYWFIYKNKRYILEVWGKTKTYKQLKWVENWFLIKDEISIWDNKNEIPLWMLGFLY